MATIKSGLKKGKNLDKKNKISIKSQKTTQVTNMKIMNSQN